MGSDDDMVAAVAHWTSSPRRARCARRCTAPPTRTSRSRRLAADVLSGALPLDHLITDRIGLADVPAAFDRMSRGEGARSVVELS